MNRATALAISAVLCVACSPNPDTPQASGGATGAVPVVRGEDRSSLPAPRPTRAALPDFSALVERYGDAVVNVDVVATLRAPVSDSPDRASPLQDFLRR